MHRSFEFWRPSCLLTLVALFVPGIWFWRRKRLPAPYPPGPPGLPILGNIFDMPKVDAWLQFSKWGREYGPIVYLDLLGQPFVVLNSAKAIIELLQRRGGNYANRPRSIMVGEIIGYSGALILSQYDRVHREQRKLIAGTFGKDQISRFHEYLEKKAAELAYHFLDKSVDIPETIRKYNGSILLHTIYGLDDREDHSEHLGVAYQCSTDFLRLSTPGLFLVDSLPFLKYIPSWVPLSPQRQARRWRENAAKLSTLPYEEAKRRALEGTAHESLISRISARGDLKNEKEFNLSIMAATLLLAGVDTNGMAMHSTIIALMNYTEEQCRGQAEIDRVVGSGRLPSMKDREQLPFVVAFCRELLRLEISAPLGFFHVSSSDDIYEGYFIPAGTMVMPNTWEILRDPQYFPDPGSFKPERFLNNNGPGIDLVDFGFGYGRRQCPGKYLAFDQLFITVATLMAVFHIRPTETQLPTNSQFGIARRIETSSTNCIITPRSPDAMTLLESARSLSPYTST